MLQSAIFSDLHAADLDTGRNSLSKLFQVKSRKNSFSRLAHWGRTLFSRDDLSGLNGHLLRDIGLLDHAVD
ncbi:hypothetical protein LGH83_03580 [Lichenihabitans sp. PAMC28606]|uniref:hypothetical protein n=1 Tax=Lichenihabitans sp. PAMC28606 TaxID=2880932 RepID=UPI001D0A49D7|nr:hypothetical protein [Lichenihabitans sp. PAMC28606]UDL95321.1 hypothetical protein LGH83_03580 [Lichenihabitans sp. PAMC28606]